MDSAAAVAAILEANVSATSASSDPGSQDEYRARASSSNHKLPEDTATAGRTQLTVMKQIDVELPLKEALKSPSSRSALSLALCFLLIHVSFYSAQNIQTSRANDPTNVGSKSLAVLYAFYSLSALFNPAIIKRFGLRACLPVCSLAYVLFVSTNIPPVVIPIFSYIACGLLGCGASILWTCQGVFVTRTSMEYEALNRFGAGKTARGAFNGLFFAVYQVSQFAGNLFVGILFDFNLDSSQVYVIMTAVAAVGAGGLIFLRYPDSSAENVPEVRRRSSIQEVQLTVKLLSGKAFLLLIPMIMFNGLMQGLFYGTLPGMVTSSIPHKFYTVALLGVVDAIASTVLGKIIQRIGYRNLSIIGTLTMGLGCMLIIFENRVSRGGSMIYFVSLAILFGFSDAIWNTVHLSMLSLIYPSEEHFPSAFANFRLFEGLTQAASFFYYPYTTAAIQAMITISVLMTAMLSLLILLKQPEQNSGDSDRSNTSDAIRIE